MADYFSPTKVKNALQSILVSSFQSNITNVQNDGFDFSFNNRNDCHFRIDNDNSMAIEYNDKNGQPQISYYDSSVNYNGQEALGQFIDTLQQNSLNQNIQFDLENINGNCLIF